MSGEDRLRKRNYYSVTLDSDRDDNYLFERIEGDIVVARQWDGSRYAEELLSLPVNQFVDKPIEIRYYLRRYEFQRTDARAFEIGSTLGWYRLVALFFDISQGAYNYKSPATTRRFELLEMLIAEALDERDRSFTVYSVLTELYGSRIAVHPEFPQMLNYYTLLLESLGDEELLTSDGNGSYRLAPRALTAFNTYEDEERRHTDSQKTQRSVKWITIVAALATVIQALAAWNAMSDTLTTFGRWVVAALGL